MVNLNQINDIRKYNCWFKKCISKYKQFTTKVIVSESFLNELALLIWFNQDSQTNILEIKKLKISQILEKLVKIKSYSLNLQKFYTRALKGERTK
ncbi:hypothetical protein HYN56_08230 [Flavobacterium crocinum]|uniref:Uncharacterized protein n=1 Tax=Flavobacterium crocinum TaxID=2183896 RepID=A0A2S1YJH1_9FLAO|nr:hypothetical protein HYN56_08230 [Flavobacterium crocinum]